MFFPIFFSYRIPSSPARSDLPDLMQYKSVPCSASEGSFLTTFHPLSSSLSKICPFKCFSYGLGPSKDVYKGNSSVHKLYQFCISFLNVHLCSIQGRWWILLKIVHFPSSSFIKSIIVVRLVMRSISFHDTMAIKWLFLANVTDPTNHG